MFVNTNIRYCTFTNSNKQFYSVQIAHQSRRFFTRYLVLYIYIHIIIPYINILLYTPYMNCLLELSVRKVTCWG